ncbi:fumarylacetoacetate hydrolase family protein [Salinibacterium sp. M195]|uniref:fumarylacetoacetate hydrolase family protein n=1 Tax=Salinibacterium sp. M195 TaxID=2583374 RepID=UPI00351D1E9A
MVRVAEDVLVDVSDLFTDFDAPFFAAGGVDTLRAVVDQRAAAGETRGLGGERIGAPIARPHQIICVGLNYRKHAIESNMPIPDEPILFTKAPNTLVGPDDDIWLPRGESKTDWEVELGIVIGRRSLYLDSDDAARAAIAGYVLSNDVSERAFQLERGGQWTKGKSSPTFNPCGPWLATADEFENISDLDLWLEVNGDRYQNGSTSDLIFDPIEIVKYISQFMILEPGDLINTGTPSGVGMGMTPQRWLHDGDTIELSISGLGVQHQNVITTPSNPLGLTAP